MPGSLFKISTPAAPTIWDDSNDEDAAMDLDYDGSLAGPSTKPVITGELIASARDWMRGHGTFLEGAEGGHPDGQVRSSVVGSVERVNRLVSVRAFRGRYRPEVGDLVIGRICEVQPKRWKVEAGARQDAVLMLGSVNLPGGVQRRKLESDELQMRNFFQEGDLLVAEVQAFFADGAMSLHTRSLKYGKLRNGILVRVPSQLVVRLKSHFHSLACGVDLIIGLNGYIWVAKRRKDLIANEGPGREGLEGGSSLMYSDVNEELPPAILARIARAAACISILAENAHPISDVSIAEAYDASLEVSGDSPDGLLRPELRERVILAMGR